VARVLWRDAQGKEGSLELGHADAVIGRAVECAIRTDDAMVSRNHARVLFDGRQYYVEDLGSANGVYYQEQRVTRHALSHGDAVRCGSLWLRFIDLNAAMPGPAGAEPAIAPGQMGSAGPPPMAAGGPMPGPGPMPAAAPPHPVASARPELMAMSAADQDSARLRRRIEQLQSEIKILRGGGERADKMQKQDEEILRLNEQVAQLSRHIDELEAHLAAEGGDAKLIKAGLVAQTASEIVAGLNDVLSNLRINVMAAEGEFDQYAEAIPRASFELIREALRSSASDMEVARELLRKLRKIAG